jgi:PAS domain S-box-containing protein
MATQLTNKRRQDLKSFQLLDTIPEKEYDDITSLAAYICDAPISLVSLVGDTRLFFKSHYGLDITETPVDQSFSVHARKNPQEIFMVEDARKDERFQDNPLVTGKLNFVFYAGIPLLSSQGHVLGTLSVIDHKPRKLEQKQVEALEFLAYQVVQLFELRRNRVEMKEMAENLAAESQRLTNIINATRVGTWEWHIPSGKVTINERWAEMLGYRMEELEPLTIEKTQQFIFPADSATVNEKIAACFEQKSAFYEGDFRFLHKNGRIAWIQDRGQVVSWSEEGYPLLMAGTHTDITERKTTETQFKSITNNIPGAVFRYKLLPDGTDELQAVSNGAEKLWGFSAEEVMQNNDLIWGWTKKDDLEALVRSIQKSTEELSFWEHEWRHHHPDGRILWLKGTGNPFRMENGCTIWDTIVLDITDQKESELSVEQSEKRFKGLVQNGSDLIAIFDYKANYQYVSPTSTSILGVDPEKLVGKNALAFIHPDDKKAVHVSFARAKEEKQVAVNPFRIRHGDGSWRWVETIVTNLMDDPAVGGLVANARDVTERIRTEKKLKKSEAYYRGLYESQTSYVTRTDMDGKCTYANKKFVEEFGWLYPDGKVLGESSLTSVMEYHHQKIQETVAQCVAEPEKVVKIEIDKPGRNGKITTTLWDFMCIIDAEGTPAEMQSMGLDITDRITTEKALKESESRYSDLFHLSPQPKFVFDVATLKFLDVNEAAIKHYGYTYDEFRKMTIEEIRPESEIPTLNAVLNRPEFMEKHYLLGEYLHRKKNGEEIIVEIRTNDLVYKGKEAKVVIATDITERKKAEREITDYKYTIDQSSIVAITDQKGIIKHVNENFCNISKYSAQELIGQDHRIISSGYHPQSFIKNLWTTIANGNIWKGELKNKAKDGTIYWVDTTIVPFLDKKGKPYQYMAIRSDITERYKYIRDIEAQNEKLKEIAWTQSHMVRAPLARIMGLAGLLQDDTISIEEKDKAIFLTHILNSANDLDDVIRNIVYTSQQEDIS